MEDSAKVHKGKARLPRLNCGICKFNQLPSSLDLNPIEKIQRQMKNEITKLKIVPMSVKDIKEVLQELWNEVDPKEQQYLTERLTVKLKDIINSKGIATVY